MKKSLLSILVLLLLLPVLLSSCSLLMPHEQDTFAGEELTALHSFTRLADGERHSGSPVNAAGGQTVILTQKLSHGTPYEHKEVVFDPNMLRAAEEAKNTALSEDSEYQWRFTPLAPGETEVMLITRYLTDDILECLVLHIHISQDLNCEIDWYEHGTIGEHYRLISE